MSHATLTLTTPQKYGRRIKDSPGISGGYKPPSRWEWEDALRERYPGRVRRKDRDERHCDAPWVTACSELPCGIEATYVYIGGDQGIKVFGYYKKASVAFKGQQFLESHGFAPKLYSESVEIYLDRGGYELYGFRTEHVPTIGEGDISGLLDAIAKTGLSVYDTHNGNYGTTSDGRTEIVDTGANTITV